MRQHPSDRNGKLTEATNPVFQDDIQQRLGNQVQNQERIMSDWQPNHHLKNGRFIIIDTLGKGGFGIAYLARDTQLNRKVVIKTLNEKVQCEPTFEKFKKDFKKEFKNEAERLSQCRHFNIVPIYDIFDEGQLPCIVMEYIIGETLARHLDRSILQEEKALHYIRQIGAALEVVHSKGLVHRDVKPANIMIREGTQEAVLIDFGIAREFHHNKLIIQTIYVSGSYAPLEQYEENEPKGPYTDVYALAATLYVLLTRENPATAQDRARSLFMSENDPLKPPRQLNNKISVQVNDAILEGMKLKPKERPQSIQNWLNLLPINEGEFEKQPKKPDFKNPPGRKKPPVADDPTPTLPPTSINTNSPELLGRAAFMGVAIWLLVISILKLIVNSDLSYVLSLLLCVGFIFLSQDRLLDNNLKISLFISAGIPTLLIFLAIVLHIIPNVRLDNLTLLPTTTYGLLTIGAGAIAFTLMAALKFFIESDNAS